MGAWEDGFAAGYRAGIVEGGTMGLEPQKTIARAQRVTRSAKKQRRASAYSKRYGAAFKRLQNKYKTKSGAWRKGGFKACQKAAHKAAKK